MNKMVEYTKEYVLSLKYQNTTNPFKQPIEFVKVSKKILSEPIVIGENAWSSSKLATDAESEIIKVIKGILNKISVNNFEVLSNKLYTLDITTERCVKELIQIVFNKSILEENFSDIYANLCYKLSKRDYKISNTNVFNFRSEIIKQCQNVFENEDEQKSVMLGNINFIGELYNKDLIPADVIFNCINKFFTNIEESKNIEKNTESLCKLIITTGKKIERTQKDTDNNIVSICFDNLTVLSTNNDIKPRYRFMIKDLIDLRKNAWVNKRNQKILLNKN